MTGAEQWQGGRTGIGGCVSCGVSHCWAVTGITAAVALVLGVIGFGKYGKPQPFLDQLYRTVSCSPSTRI